MSIVVTVQQAENGYPEVPYEKAEDYVVTVDGFLNIFSFDLEGDQEDIATWSPGTWVCVEVR